MHDASAASGRPRRRRTIITLVIVAVLLLAAAGATAGYLALRTRGSPTQTAASYLHGWQQSSYRAMDAVTVNAPPGGLAGPLQQAAAQLGLRSLHLRLGRVTSNGGTALARFTATAELASGHAWTYQGRLQLVKRNRHWWVSWSPAAIYPGLRAGERFALRAVWPPRAQILAADGTVLSSPQAIAQSGSLSLVTGYVVAATAAQAKALGAPYQAGDGIGLGGIEQAYQRQLAGQAAISIRIVGPGSQLDAVAAHFPARPGTPVRTSIEMRYQLAASAAIRSAATSKPVDFVAIQPSTGRVLAVVERPGGFDRALQGEFPPGSTFKVVTASALSRTGLRPSSTVECPPTTTTDGRTLHNWAPPTCCTRSRSPATPPSRCSPPSG
jgi:Penicillin binding protein transpeptidase domain/NTF2-like N-terminal transpeptidase domain/Penicillin-binding Protein dimerisation domain